MASFVLPLISGLAGMFGGGSSKQTNTNSTTNQSGTQSQNYGNQSSSTPTLNPFQQQLAGMFSQGAMNQYTNGTNMAPYTSQGLQQIQGQGNSNSKTIANNLAARGLSYSPAAANTTTQNTLNTGNQMNSFLQGVPLLQHQLQQGNLQQLMQAFATQPTGVSTTGSGTASGTSTGTSNTVGQSTQSTPGGLLAGLFSGLGGGLAAPAQGGGSNLSSILNMFGLGGSSSVAAGSPPGGGSGG
jgi:hypothetical protein